MKKREKDEQESKKSKRSRRPIAVALCVVMLVIALGSVALGLLVQSRFEAEIPTELFFKGSLNTPPRLIYYRFSDRVNRVGEAQELESGAFKQPKLPYVSYEAVPQSMVDAFVSIEDKRFFHHRGVDWYRTAAATVSYAFGFSNRFGASTITQQTVKNVTGNDQVTLSRKIQEILYARDLERLLSKEEILELYLNVISFSDGCVGIGAAAEHYFSVEPRDLTVAQCASIAAITNNPSYYNPIRHPEHNQKRRDLILFQMKEQGYLTNEAYEEAIASPLGLCVQDDDQESEMRSWYTDMVIEDVIQDLCATYKMSRSAASMRVHNGGLRIDVAIDPVMQERVEELYRSVIRTPQNQQGESAQSALIVLDSQTGDILAVAGGIGEKKGNRVQNFATQALRSPGSAIKPITVYGQALEKGIINWASVYDDVPIDFETAGKGRPWPANATGVYRGLTGISYAVAHSTNTVSIRVLQELGLRESFQTARDKYHLEHLVDQVGVTDCDVAALALGQLNYGLTLRELACAYTVFADRGCYHRWHSYYRVIDQNGELLLTAPDVSEPVMSEGNAAVMTKLLQGVVEEGTSSSITLQGLVECAGKTGTTQNDGDRWFVGYTPDLICGVWCGFEYPEPIQGGNVCTGIWNTVMRQIWQRSEGRRRFEIPSNVVQRSYCRDSGKQTDEACLFDPRGERTQTGWFVRGKEPEGRCDRHVLCHEDAESHGLSCGLCPEESLSRIALIRVERHFPRQIIVTDAQYAWRGDPKDLPPNPNGGEAYFEGDLSDFCGRSLTNEPRNRSCPIHQEPVEGDEWEESESEREALDPRLSRRKPKPPPFWRR